MQCASCKEKKCRFGQNCTQLTFEQVEAVYTEKDKQIILAAAKGEGELLTRLEESVKFCQAMGCENIGVAFCMGLADEAKYIVQYFQKYFTVHSVCCKVCGVGKQQFNPEHYKNKKADVMCNPTIQAQILNDAATEINFTVGLCVGHDMIFGLHSKAPVSTLAVKDRVLANNPLGAIYSGFSRKRLGLVD
ncbi:MAG: hypothetical protein H6Q72_4326 [Firmicutes bacterium]|nr:hypothetical protein [Bacillota bacterium]